MLHLMLAACALAVAQQGPGSVRGVCLEPGQCEFDDALKQKLQNMIVYHSFSLSEMALATGRPIDVIQRAIDHFRLSSETQPELPEDGTILVLPYPGGRHPRIGFLDGARDPRSDTKVSLVSPWAEREYVVVDLPEAIWWEDELLFLAHTHIPTLWTKAGIELPDEPWVVQPDRSLSNQRTLPNGVTISATIRPIHQGAMIELGLTNHGEEPLRNLRAQVCVLLRGLSEFRQQSTEFTTLQSPYAVRRSRQTPNHWLVTAWNDCHRAWTNPDCPCLHSDPAFPDCLPGETVRARGVIAFVEADDVQTAIQSVEQLDWADPSAGSTTKAP
ncbi:hypothetical protein [Tautonia rosea]|uniref:hypothetical protein n=1 Tax=Tautonia rosea TaxID=2728037 RepID=UPI0014747E94|nr:hypothetical protein [Tautonia rosea]